MSRFFKNKPSLVDFITPENVLLDARVLKNGVRFRFSERVLPPWVFELARRFDFAVTDDDPSGLRGRVVSLINDKKRSRDIAGRL